MEKYKKIKNKNYRQFLDTGIINILSEDHITQALSNIKGKYIKEGRALLITLYYTGARPVEILQLKAKDIKKERSYVTIRIPGSKRGLPRTIYLRYKKDLVKELYLYANGIFDEAYLFFHYRGEYVRTVMTKQGLKQRIETSDKIRYHIKKWFKNVIDDSIPPYYLRHNRMSKWSEAGLNTKDLRMLKGSRTEASVMPYIHMSKSTAQKAAKKTD